MKQGWVPPRSPYSLIQEDLWSADPSSEWWILVVCLFLNCTRRKQVERTLPGFMARWNDPASFLLSEHRDVVDCIRSLGFGDRRAANLRKMTQAYLTGGWSHARELPGVGIYAARAWEIFCRGELGTEAPKDHALVKYWAWCRQRGQVSNVPLG